MMRRHRDGAGRVAVRENAWRAGAAVPSAVEPGAVRGIRA